MNQQELARIAKYAHEVWPRTFEVKDPESFTFVWMDLLGEFDADDVLSALKTLSGQEFPPSPGQLRARLLKARGGIAEWDEVWRWVRQLTSRSTLYLYDDHPPFACPWPDLEGLITIEDVQGWARAGLTEGDLETVVQGHVRRRFESAKERAVSSQMARPALVGGPPRHQLSDGTDGGA